MGCGPTYGAESNPSSSQAYEAAVARMRLMNGICILFAELVEDSLDSTTVLGCHQLSDKSLKSSKDKLALPAPETLTQSWTEPTRVLQTCAFRRAYRLARAGRWDPWLRTA